jgi:hypothetical protein
MYRASNFYHYNEVSDNPSTNVVTAGHPRAIVVDHFQRAKSESDWKKVEENGTIEMAIRSASQGHPTRINYAYPGVNYSFGLGK